jgi:bacterial leucyl aminopeptidase
VITSAISAVFFALDNSFGTLVLDDEPPGLATFEVLPFIAFVLADLKIRGCKLGVISNIGADQETAIKAVLGVTVLPLFDPELLVDSGGESPLIDDSQTSPGLPRVSRKTPEIFCLAAQRAGLHANPEKCLYVGEDAQDRAVAAASGWRTCPHPLLVDEILDGEPLHLVRLTTSCDRAAWPWRPGLPKPAFVPLQFSGTSDGVVLGLTSVRMARLLDAMGFDVDVLDNFDGPRAIC